MLRSKLLTDPYWFRMLKSPNFLRNLKNGIRIGEHFRIDICPTCVNCHAAFGTSVASKRTKRDSFKEKRVTRDTTGRTKRSRRFKFDNGKIFNFDSGSNVPSLPNARTLEDIIQPVKLSVDRSSSQNIGEQLTSELDKDDVKRLLQSVHQDPQILELLEQRLSIKESMLRNVLRSFQYYCTLTENLPVELHITLYDLIHGTGSNTDLVPYIVDHASKVFPHLGAMDDLKHLIVQNMVNPVSWYPEARRLKRKIIYHSGPTNSGKTYAALKRFMEAETGVYLAPLRLLAIECFTKTNGQDVPCDLLTGERKYYIDNEDNPANHRSSTIELLDFRAKYDVAVIDEIQMIGDLFRGGYWTQSVLGVIADEVHVCGDGSALKIVESLAKQCGDSFEVMKYQRKSPLVVQKQPLGSLKNVRPGDCIVCFSVKSLFQVGGQLKQLGHNCALIYGALPPGIKINQTEMYNDPDNACNVLVATDAVGMGLNLAIQRIIFHGVEKVNLRRNKGELINRFSKEKMLLSPSEATQIAGRAGRYGGQYEKEGGLVTALNKEDLKKLQHILKQQIPKIEKAGLVLRGDVVETFAYYLPGVPFSRVLMMFIAMCETDKEYFMCDSSPLVQNAMLIDHIDMSLKDKLVFCQSPLRHSVSSASIQTFVQMAKYISNEEILTTDQFLNQVGYTRSKKIEDVSHFKFALEVFHLTDIYLWLSFKFQEFNTVTSMRAFRTELDKDLRNFIQSQYSSIDKGSVLKLAHSAEIRELIAEKETFEAPAKDIIDQQEAEGDIESEMSSTNTNEMFSFGDNNNHGEIGTDNSAENDPIQKEKKGKKRKTRRQVEAKIDTTNQFDDDPLSKIWYKNNHTRDTATELGKGTTYDIPEENTAKQPTEIQLNGNRFNAREIVKTAKKLPPLEIYEERLKERVTRILDGQDTDSSDSEGLLDDDMHVQKDSMAPLQSDDTVIEIPIPESYVGKLIGKAGANINKIRFETGTIVNINEENPGEATCVIIGKEESIIKATQMVYDCLYGAKVKKPDNKTRTRKTIEDENEEELFESSDSDNRETDSSVEVTIMLPSTFIQSLLQDDIFKELQTMSIVKVSVSQEDDQEDGVCTITGEEGDVMYMKKRVSDRLKEIIKKDSATKCNTPMQELLYIFMKQGFGTALKYNFISYDPHKFIYTYGIEGFDFTGKGESKKEAKQEVAALVLDELKENGNLDSYFPEHKALTTKYNSPMQALRDIFMNQGFGTALKYNLISFDKTDPHKVIYTYGIEGFDFTVKGTSRKKAMQEVAALVLDELKENGNLDSYFPEHKALTTKYNSPMNALLDIFMKQGFGTALKYNLISFDKTGPRIVIYTYGIEGFDFTGKGESKKKAKQEVAALVLDELKENGNLDAYFPEHKALTTKYNSPMVALVDIFMKQGFGTALKYNLISFDKTDPHKFIYTYGIEGFDFTGKGSSKKKAMQEVAALVLEELKENGNLESYFPEHKTSRKTP